jgi:peptidyl-prolyl cis-trans isomerase C
MPQTPSDDRWIFCVCLLLTLSAVFTGCQKAIPLSPNARVLATVNDETITMGEFQKEMEPDSQTPQDPEAFQALKHDLLQQLIEQRLCLKEARRLNLAVSDDELEQTSNKIQRDHTPEEFNELLKTKQLSLEAWKAKLKEQLLVKKLQEQVTNSPDLEVTMEEARRYYDANRLHFFTKESVHVRQIVTAKEEEAKAIRQELLKGGDFAKMASSKSLGPEKNQGGDIGFVTREGLPDEFDLIFSQGIGKISPVIKSTYGYHVFKVEERRPAHQQTFTEALETIKAILLQVKREQRFSDWLTDLQHRSDIKINEQLLNEVSG